MRTPELHPTYRALNKPLTIWGVERRLFFLAAMSGAATFNYFGSLLGALLMFAGLLIFFRQATKNDPQNLRIWMNSSRLCSRYDPAKYDHRSKRIFL
jgi:type IV secretory pathway TrbD component